ncbi:MAG: hypothetical protein AAGA75_23840 [Cyanobacteria bacterium P01_E01_bin.6]
MKLIIPVEIDHKKIQQALKHGKAKGASMQYVADQVGLSRFGLAKIARGGTETVSLKTALTIEKVTGFEGIVPPFFVMET